MTTYLFPGSFDPFTRGHRDIARRASKVCDKLYVTVMHNDAKSHVFTSEERVYMAKESLKDYPNIEVLCSDYEVVLLPCRDDLSLISSSIVKEVGYYGGDISKMVPSEIVDFVSEKLKKGRN